MVFYKGAQLIDILISFDTFKFESLRVTHALEIPILVPDVSNAATHAGPEVSTCFSQHYYASTGHVFTAVVANAFDDSSGAAVANTKAFRRNAVEVRLARSCAVHYNVTNKDIVLGLKCTGFWRVDNNSAPRLTFADVIVTVALNFQSNAFG